MRRIDSETEAALRLMTWNMQGGNEGKYDKISQYMKHYKINIVCLQETGTLPNSYVNREATINDVRIRTGAVSGLAPGGMLCSVVNYNNDAGGHNRCSLAILSEPAVLKIWAIPGPSKLRPIIGIQLAGNRWIYCVHAPSGHPSSAAGVTSSMLDDIPLAHANWACIGDYNCSPDRINCANTTAAGGLAPTHIGGGRLDYAIARNLSVIHQNQGVVPLVSDHYSQIFDIQ